MGSSVGIGKPATWVVAPAVPGYVTCTRESSIRIWRRRRRRAKAGHGDRIRWSRSRGHAEPPGVSPTATSAEELHAQHYTGHGRVGFVTDDVCAAGRWNAP